MAKSCNSLAKKVLSHEKEEMRERKKENSADKKMVKAATKYVPASKGGKLKNRK